MPKLRCTSKNKHCHFSGKHWESDAFLVWSSNHFQASCHSLGLKKARTSTSTSALATDATKQISTRGIPGFAWMVWGIRRVYDGPFFWKPSLKGWLYSLQAKHVKTDVPMFFLRFCFLKLLGVVKNERVALSRLRSCLPGSASTPPSRERTRWMRPTCGTTGGKSTRHGTQKGTTDLGRSERSNGRFTKWNPMQHESRRERASWVKFVFFVLAASVSRCYHLTVH